MPDLTEWQFTPLALPQVFAAVLSLLAGVLVWRRRHFSPLAPPLLFLLLAQFLWAGAGALEFCSADVRAKILLTQISYLGITAGPLSLLYFTYAYLRHGGSPPPLLRVVGVTGFVLILGAAWTNPFHHLLWTEIEPVWRGDALFARYERGPFFWFTVAYCYGIMLLGSVLLTRHSLRIGGVFSRQSLIILLATFAPWSTSIIYVLRIGPMPELDHTPVGFAVTGLLLSLGVLRFHLFDLTPIPAETLFSRIPDPVLVIDSGNRVVRANTAARQRFGLVPSYPGNPIATLLADQPDLVALLRERSEPRWKHTLAVGEVWWEIESGPVGGRSHSRLILLRDITEQKRAERLLADALARTENLRREADAANAAKSTFLAQVSHDLRTPLHAILGISELMLSGPLDERLRADASTIREAGGILLRLINDLLDLSRIEAGRVDLARETFRLDAAVQPVVELLSVKARAKNLTLSHRLHPGLPTALSGDMDRLRQILFNLVGNAVKFTAAGSVSLEVHPGLHAGRPALFAEISDTGPGIPPDRLASVFEPFERGDAGTRQQEGTGLGLAIARSLARAMDGDVTVVSTPDAGSTFTLRLPLLPAHAPAGLPGLRIAPDDSAPRPSPPPAPAPRPPHGRALRVLLADDQTISRRVSGALLRACGCQVTEVDDGPEALAAVSPEHDLIVLDGQMQKLDGWDVARLIRAGEAGQTVRDKPILALTADLTPETRVRWLKAGVDIILAKPNSIDELGDAIRRVLEHPTTPAPAAHRNPQAP